MLTAAKHLACNRVDHPLHSVSQTLGSLRLQEKKRFTTAPDTANGDVVDAEPGDLFGAMMSNSGWDELSRVFRCRILNAAGRVQGKESSSAPRRFLTGSHPHRWTV
jgi:hypothetical protein